MAQPEPVASRMLLSFLSPMQWSKRIPDDFVTSTKKGWMFCPYNIMVATSKKPGILNFIKGDPLEVVGTKAEATE
jgi:hypothetical protein